MSHGSGTIARCFSFDMLGQDRGPEKVCLVLRCSVCFQKKFLTYVKTSPHTPVLLSTRIPTGVCNHKRYLNIAIPQHEASRLRHPDRLCAKYLAEAFQLHLSPLISFNALCFLSSWPSCICAFEYCPSEGGLFM